MISDQKREVLRVSGLKKCISKRTLVDDITFHINEGEIFGFLGPNGAGKTTIIRMLVGLIRPTAGTVSIFGHHLARDPLNALKHVGCIVENPELYPYLTGRENLELFSRMTEGVLPERINQVAQQVELGDRLDDTVKTYSLGMKQRLGLAQSLLHRPKLLILDEPTNGLDPAGIREIRQLILQLAQMEKMSVLISSHILHEIQLMCDRVAILNRGRMIRVSPVERLLEGDGPVEWGIDPLDRGLEVLQSLPYVHDLEPLSDRRIRTHIPEEKIGDVNRELIRAGIRVEAMDRQSLTLEDIFLQMTEGDSSG